MTSVKIQGSWTSEWQATLVTTDGDLLWRLESILARVILTKLGWQGELLRSVSLIN